MFILNLFTIATLASHTVSGMPIGPVDPTMTMKVAHHTTSATPPAATPSASSNVSVAAPGSTAQKSSTIEGCLEHIDDCTPGELAATIVGGVVVGGVGLTLLGIVGYTLVNGYRSSTVGTTSTEQFEQILDRTEEAFQKDVISATNLEDVLAAIKKQSLAYNTAVEQFAKKTRKAQQIFKQRQELAQKHDSQFAEAEWNGFIEKIRKMKGPAAFEQRQAGFLDGLEKVKAEKVADYKVWIAERNAGRNAKEAEAALARLQAAKAYAVSVSDQAIEIQYNSRLQTIEDTYADRFSKASSTSEIMIAELQLYNDKSKLAEEFKIREYKAPAAAVEPNTEGYFESLIDKIKSSGKANIEQLVKGIQSYAQLYLGHPLPSTSTSSPVVTDEGLYNYDTSDSGLESDSEDESASNSRADPNADSQSTTDEDIPLIDPKTTQQTPVSTDTLADMEDPTTEVLKEADTPAFQETVDEVTTNAGENALKLLDKVKVNG